MAHYNSSSLMNNAKNNAKIGGGKKTWNHSEAENEPNKITNKKNDSSTNDEVEILGLFLSQAVRGTTEDTSALSSTTSFKVQTRWCAWG